MEILFENYVRNIRCGAQSAWFLAMRLEKAAREDQTAEQKKALRHVLACAREVKLVQAERDRLAPGKVRPTLEAYMNAWSAFFESLAALARLSPTSKDGVAAQKLMQSVFADGVSFTKLPGRKAWTEGQRRLDRIAEEGLRDEIATLIGERFIDSAKSATADLADVLGVGKDSVPAASSTALVEALAKFSRAVCTYGRLMVASVDIDDERSMKRFLEQMGPIDEHRAEQARNGGEDVDSDEPIEGEEPATPPATPVTPAPAGPTPEPVR